MSESDRVIVSSSLGEFFRDEVSGARQTLGVKLPEMAEYYLVNLLVDYGRTGQGPLPGEEPLAFLYKRALEAPPAVRMQPLKHLGDLALYVAGFFADWVERSHVAVDYYVSMGGNAYDSLSGIVGAHPQGDTFAELYQDLSRRFGELVDVLNEVADRSRDVAERSSDLLKLYDRWVRTGSQRIERMLVDKGLVLAPGIPTDYVQ
ncbi:MAG: hypothetical protein AAB426_12210 [Myxococcota bacterium]